MTTPPEQPEGTVPPAYQPPPATGAYPPPPPLQQPPPAGAYPPPAYGQQSAYPPPGYGQQPGYPPAPGYPPPGYPAVPESPGRYFDPTSGIYLPNGTELASVGRRIGAYFLSILLFIVTLGIGYIIWGLILWGQGTSPALRVLKCKCYRPDTGQVPTWGRMFIRDFLGRIVDGIVGAITEIVSFVMFVSGNKRQSLHDLIGGTVVLYDPNKTLG
jgi:uncharacterized RDD family membrane protein YckC